MFFFVLYGGFHLGALLTRSGFRSGVQNPIFQAVGSLRREVLRPGYLEKLWLPCVAVRKMPSPRWKARALNP